MSMRLVISGCCGRMGRAIAQLALQDSAFELSAGIEAKGHEAIGCDLGTVLGRPSALGVKILDDPRAAMSRGDVVIEFTTPDVTIQHAKAAYELGKPMVIGTTGLTKAQQVSLDFAAKTIPMVFSPNMSLGMNVLFELARLASRRLGLGFDVEIVESHHREKKDVPSGTAKRLAEVLALDRLLSSAPIPVHAVRAGDIVGDHTVILAGPAERLELTHRAHSRDVFAQGALRAARFVVTQKPGLYNMSHVLDASTMGSDPKRGA